MSEQRHTIGVYGVDCGVCMVTANERAWYLELRKFGYKPRRALEVARGWLGVPISPQYCREKLGEQKYRNLVESMRHGGGHYVG